MQSADRVAFFKSMRLGDVVHGPDGIAVPGEDPSFKAPLYATRGTFNDRGAASHYEIEVIGDLIRNYYENSEDTSTFELRRLYTMAYVRKVRGYATGASTTAGILAIVNDATHVRTTTAPIVAGSVVAVPYSGTAITSASVAGTLFLIASNSGSLVSEIVVATGATAGVTFTATTLVNSYSSGATIAPVAWYIPGVYLLAGTKIAADDPAGFEASRDISFVFQGVDDAIYSAGTIAP